MWTKFAVVGSNLVVAYEEIKILELVPQLYPQDFVDFFIHNYFRFLDEVFHKWLENFDLQHFYNKINNLDLDLQFIFENPSKSLNFLDINIRIVEKNMVFSICYKPTNSFNCLTCTSCHPLLTNHNISLSLAKCTVSIVINNRENWWKELKEHLIDRKHLFYRTHLGDCFWRLIKNHTCISSHPAFICSNQPWKRQNNVWNLFKVNNKDTRITSLTFHSLGIWYTCKLLNVAYFCR